VDRVQNLTHKGKTIILVDLSNCKPEDSMAVIPIAQKKIAASPPKSARILTDVTNSTYTAQVANAIKEFGKANTPYVKKSVVVGADGVRAILMNTVIFLTRREIKLFDTRQSALDYLALD
jgi:hypothetical protein